MQSNIVSQGGLDEIDSAPGRPATQTTNESLATAAYRIGNTTQSIQKLVNA
jgi:hypothetical protein